MWRCPLWTAGQSLSAQPLTRKQLLLQPIVLFPPAQLQPQPQRCVSSPAVPAALPHCASSVLPMWLGPAWPSSPPLLRPFPVPHLAPPPTPRPHSAPDPLPYTLPP